MHRRIALLSLAFCAAAAFRPVQADPPAADAMRPVRLPAAAQALPPRPEPAPRPLQVTGGLETSVAVPAGSYLRTCRVPKATSATLSAECAGREGRWISSTLSYPRCGGADIANRHGWLACVTALRENWGGHVLPPGSWLATCPYGAVEGTVLRASCLTGSQVGSGVPLIDPAREGWDTTRLDLARCPHGADIANIRGQLTCVGR